MTAVQSTSGKTVNRMLHINESAGDLLNKLEAVRLICQETGCAQRYLTHDALNALAQLAAGNRDGAAATLTEQSAVPRNYFWITVMQVQSEVAAALGDRCGGDGLGARAAGGARDRPR